MTELLATPNLGTGVLEHRDRIDFGALRDARRQRVLSAMEEHGLDACLFGREANARYVSGVRRLWTAQTRPFVPACVVVPAPPGSGERAAHVELLSFSASYEDIPAEVGPDSFFPVTWNPGKMMARFQQIPGFLDARRVGFDGLSPLFEGLLRSLLPAAEFVGVEDVMRGVHRRKLPAEIVCIRTAAAIAESALYAAASEIRPGVTERHLQAVFLERMCTLGTSQFARQGTFTVIDPDAPLRWITSDRALDEDSMVALAGGVLWAGYEGSLARTWWCGRQGRPTGEQRALFSRWRDLTAAVREQCRPGHTGADLRAAYERTGEREPALSIAYSVGLGHEGPLAGPGMSAALEREQVLEPDMVVAVRAFVSGGGGGFLGEDMILVTDAGPEALTTLGYGPLAAEA
jgi:Xaa-Pro dipeptidase